MAVCLVSVEYKREGEICWNGYTDELNIMVQ